MFFKKIFRALRVKYAVQLSKKEGWSTTKTGVIEADLVCSRHLIIGSPNYFRRQSE